MRILFISDPHLSSSNVHYLEDVLESEDYDVILSAGDWDELPKYFKKYDIYTIYGNHDDLEVLKSRTQLMNDLNNPAGANVVDVDGVIVCALGGAVVRDNFSYPETWHTPDEYLRGYFLIKEKLMNEYGKCDILITHDAPLSLVEFEKEHLSAAERNNIDFKSYRDVFDVIAKLLSPKLYLCGHVHSTSVTMSVVRNFDIYSNTHDVPVVKNVFARNMVYTTIDTVTKQVTIKSWSGEVIETKNYWEKTIVK